MKNNYKMITNLDSRRLPLILWGGLVGGLAGFVVVLYRITLLYAEYFCFAIYDFLREHYILLPLWGILLVIMAYVVGFLVRKNRMISGSGIPQVKGILMGYFHDNWLSTLILKFIAGTAGIIAGLSLGREGPSIQLGACIAQGFSQKFKGTNIEKKILIASGASAGLAAAFNAPLAGVMFVLEEIFKYFSPMILLTCMSSAIVADFVSKQVFGINTVFQFETTQAIPLENYWVLILLGIVLGLLGAFYNLVLIKTQKVYKRMTFLTVLNKPVIAFILAGILGIVFPFVLGGGHEITKLLNLQTSITFLLILLGVKFIFSMISFGSGTPGGIFFPLLVIGGMIGAIFGKMAIEGFNMDTALFYNFVILAMAGYFTAIVRAPITGIILITEMTNSLQHLLPLTVVSIIAYIVADLLRSSPIYDTLLENQLEDQNIVMVEEEHSKKIIMDFIVHMGAPVMDKSIKDIKWPSKCLLVAIKRGEVEIIPNGNTVIKEGDYMMVMTDTNSEVATREGLILLTSNED